MYYENVSVKLRKIYEFDSVECADFCIASDKLSPFTLCAVYRPPDTSLLRFAEDLVAYVELNITTKQQTLFMRDFNFHFEDETSPETAFVHDLLDSFDLKSLVRLPAHKAGYV